MNKLIAYAITSLLACFTLIVQAQTLAQDPLVFAEPIPTFPRDVVANDSEVVQFTLSNTGDHKIKLYPSIESVLQDEPVLRRINLNVANDCGENGSVLNPNDTCSLTYAVEVTTHQPIGEIIEQQLDIKYKYKHRWYHLNKQLNINVVSAKLAYSADQSQASARISVCDINQTTGLVNSCALSQPFFSYPFDFAFTTINDKTYAFVDSVDTSSRVRIAQCTVQAIDGSINNDCIFSLLPQHIDWSGIAFNASDELYAYLASFSSDKISKCKVALTGPGFKLNSCVDQNVTVNGPRFITFHKLGTTTYAYIGHDDANPLPPHTLRNSVLKCTVDPQGDLEDCKATGGLKEAVGTGSIDVAFASAFEDKLVRAYVTFSNRGVYECTVCPITGDLLGCKNITNIPWSTPQGIAATVINMEPYVYVANGVNSLGQNLFQCGLNFLADPETCSLYQTFNGFKTFALVLR